jgi:hypothetical protein
VNFSRDDGQTGQIEPEYLIQQSAGHNIPAAYQPPVCSNSLTSGCIPKEAGEGSIAGTAADRSPKEACQCTALDCERLRLPELAGLES